MVRSLGMYNSRYLTLGVSRRCSQDSSWECSHRKVWFFWKICFQMPSCGYWPVASLGFSPCGSQLRLLARHMAACFPQRKWSERDTDTVFYNLISDVTHYHFCHIVLGTQITSGPVWEGTLQCANTRGQRSLEPFEGSLPLNGLNALSCLTTS